MPPTTITTPRTAFPLVDEMARFGSAPALLDAESLLTYAELAARVDEVAGRLGSSRKLVLLEGANRIEAVVTYLAALRGRHPVLLVPGSDPRHVAELIERYDPDVVAGGSGELEVRRTTSAHELHPELALLLSTSGSTGACKLVRLSHENLQSNAEAIATYLTIRSDDRAITSLPMSYCYGLSVINSHLARGAGIILTELSVVDRCFWDLARRHKATNFAGVPHTFDLLDRVGFDSMDVPSLRLITQAGGRLAPERVLHHAELGRRRGWDFVVMYGQTEATARMAYLPPALAREHPSSIGVPIPGGSLDLDQPDEDGVGELVYRGPNVMLGYAETTADLAEGRTVQELHTGDLARRTADGMYELVGRRQRFIKLFGLRVDLDRVETLMHQRGIEAACTGDDEHLFVAAVDSDPSRLVDITTDLIGLPCSAVRAATVSALPRTTSGKIDRLAVAALAPSPDATSTSKLSRSAREVMGHLLGRDDISDDDTFVSLGGDSMSYVEVSIQLEAALGHLPDDWHITPVRHLLPAETWSGPGAEAGFDTGRRGWARLDMTVALRAIAILLIVGTHSHVFRMQGGAHLLLGMAGFNFARFHLSPGAKLKARRMLASAAKVAVPSMIWLGGVVALGDEYSPANALLVNDLVGPPPWNAWWRYWYVEVLVQLLVVLAAVMAIPAVRRVERRHRFWFPMCLAAGGLVLRTIVDADPATQLLTPPSLVWLFALGWAAAQATATHQRLLVSLAMVATITEAFIDPSREARIVIGLLLMTWVRSVPLPSRLHGVAGALAGASLYIYLTHWQVLPPVSERFGPIAGIVAALAVGIAAWTASRAVLRIRRPCPAT